MASVNEVKQALKCHAGDGCFECGYFGDDCCGMHLSENALSVIEDLESRQFSWISVDDRLPSEGGRYLVVCQSVIGAPMVYLIYFSTNLSNLYDFRFREDGEYNRPGWYDGDSESDWEVKGVTHWMPLPKPPVGGAPT